MTLVSPRSRVATPVALCAPVVITLALAACAHTSSPASDGAHTPANGTEILWDSYGIPHIFASDARGAFYAMGWAQMEAHGDLLLRIYAQARGRAAEYWGEGNLAEDRWVRTLGGPQRGRAWYDAQTPEFRREIDAYVEGINAYGRTHPDRITDSVKVVLPVEGADVFRHFHRVLYSFFITSRDQLRGEAARWDRGSNAWAISPKRSANGHAMLLANPHLPWGDVFTWIEAQETAPGVDVYGAALVGSPVLNIAFNDFLGWTHTVNTQDNEDLYELALDGSGYRWDGAVRPFETETQVLRVRRRDGSVGLDTLVIRRSVHGPVVREKTGKALALRVTGLDKAFAAQQWWDMGRARSLDEFERAISRMQITGQNITYADRAGHILYHYGGNAPSRSRGDWAYWAGIIPGDSSSTLWTTTLGYERMPRVLDPPSGWVQNTNDPPWSVTFPPVYRPSDFPPYLAPRGMSFRTQRSVRMVSEDSSITYDELLAYKHSTRLELADRILDDLLAAARTSTDARTKRAASVLEAWDRSVDAQSRGGVLFAEWWTQLARRMQGRSPFAKPWSESAPRTTPSGLADPQAAVAALDAAAGVVESNYGAIDVPWGEVFRFRRDSVDLPGNGAPGALGAFRVIGSEQAANHRYVAAGGDSYVAVIEFGTPVRARSLVGYGNASQPGSPHRSDQLPFLARKELRPVWRTRAEVEQHLERRERL